LEEEKVKEKAFLEGKVTERAFPSLHLVEGRAKKVEMRGLRVLGEGI
jgi:hypothetical protein